MVGYDVANKPTVPPVYLCQRCSLILRDPSQLECGHRQCKSCIDATVGETIRCTVSTCEEISSRANIRLDRGFRNDMQKLMIVCSLCTWEGPLNTYDSHLSNKHPRPICHFCTQQCESAIHLDHHKLYECEKVTIPCALKNYGCVEDVIRVKMPQHYLTFEHQTALAEFVRLISVKLVNRHPGDSSSMEVDPSLQISIATPVLSKQDTITHLQGALDIKDILAEGTSTLKGDVQRLNISLNQSDHLLKGLEEEVQKLKLSIEEQTTTVSSFKPGQDALLQEVSSMTTKLSELHMISHDGMFLWKIDGMAEIIAAAVQKRQAYISSPIFYSSPTGYKMQARLYPTGDGNARDSHMSLFFLLLRSDYDAILRFPFRYTITFCLYDQTPTQRHIIDSFRPDVKSASFHRPKSERNTASGIPRFVQLRDIQQENTPYIRDDTMYIRIAVDFADLSKNMMQYAASLNPSLPAKVQLNLIKQEEQRRAQQLITLSPASTSQKPEKK